MHFIESCQALEHANRGIVFCGNNGSGKTQLVTHVLSKYKVALIVVNCLSPVDVYTQITCDTSLKDSERKQLALELLSPEEGTLYVFYMPKETYFRFLVLDEVDKLPQASVFFDLARASKSLAVIGITNKRKAISSGLYLNAVASVDK